MRVAVAPERRWPRARCREIRACLHLSRSGSKRILVSAILSPLLAVVLVGPVPAQEPSESPRSIGLTERTRSDIALVQVMVDGPDHLIPTLTAEDFRLIVDGTPVDLIAVDNQCRVRPTEEAGDRPPPVTPLAPTSYLFYFDQHNLTIGGRQNSLDIAKEMVVEIVRDGNRAAIVSAGQELRTFADFTGDVDLLVESLERLREDPKQWDDYASLEARRREDVQHSGWASSDAACLRARAYQREETIRTESALELFSSVLGRFLNEDPPKTAFYFGDTLRVKSGQHYTAMLSECVMSSFDAWGAFQGVIQDAAAFGVRIYAIQAEGLTNLDTWGTRSAGRLGAQHAQEGLKALTLDTGGDAFLGGASTKKMILRIQEDADCVYVLSFDPGGFPKDRPLSARVEVDRAKVEARARSQLLFLSDSAYKTATLLAAFTSPESVKDRLPMIGAIVPLDMQDGRFRAFVQAIIPESALPIAAEWDLGMSAVRGRAVRAEASGRIAVDRPRLPLVLEAEMEFRPGPYEVRLVGQETGSGLVATGRIAGEWPLMEQSPVITEIALLQPAAGAFLRGDASRTEGSLAVPVGRSVNAALPTAVMSLVCRGERSRKSLTVERSLTGESVVDFEPIELAFEKESCAQIRDMILGNTMTPGAFTYTVRVQGSDVTRAREFVVSGPALEEEVPDPPQRAPEQQASDSQEEKEPVDD